MNVGRWLALAAVCTTACAKVVVVPVTPGTQPGNGVFYALPKTVVRAQVKVERREPKGAPFMMYADIFAPADDPACPNRDCSNVTVTYVLKDGVTLSTYGEPDPANVYMVKFANGRAIDQKLTMKWSELGLVSSASSTVTNRSGDIALSALKLAGGIATRTAFGGFAAADAAANTGDRCLPDTHATNDAWIIPVLRGGGANADTQRTLRANYCALPLARRQQLNQADHEVRLTAAQEAYVARIEPLMTALNSQLGGSSPSLDPAAIIARIEGLLSDQLKALYLGTVDVKTWEGTIDVHDLGLNSPTPLIAINTTAGVCVRTTPPPPPPAPPAPPPPAVALAPESKPLPSNFTALAQAACDQATPVDLVANYHPVRSSQLFHHVMNGTTQPAGELSFRYRIPAQVKAEVRMNNQQYGAGILSVAQFGHVATLPAHRNAKELTYDLEFIEATGALKGFTLGSTGGVGANVVDTAAGVTNDILDARTTAREKTRTQREKEDAAAAAEVDELNILTRRANILKLRDQICELQKKYGVPCDTEP